MRRRGRTSRVSLLVLGGLTKGDLRMRFLPALLLFFPLVHAEAVYSGFSLIPHIADGGGIQMEFTLTNLDDTPSTFSFGYYDDNGNPLLITTNVALSRCAGGALAPHASCTIRTTG